jgi:hypothetical protein
MAKLNDPTARTRFGIDESDGQRRTYGKSAGAGGRHIQAGPAPGARSGVARSDGPVGRATGTSRDLTGPPRAPRR